MYYALSPIRLPVFVFDTRQETQIPAGIALGEISWNSPDFDLLRRVTPFPHLLEYKDPIVFESIEY